MVFAHRMDNSKPHLIIPTLLVPLQNRSCTETATPLPSQYLMELSEEHSWMSNQTDLHYV
ncbi:GPR19 isoform 1, partial [Pan troglodytes]